VALGRDENCGTRRRASIFDLLIFDLLVLYRNYSGICYKSKLKRYECLYFRAKERQHGAPHCGETQTEWTCSEDTNRTHYSEFLCLSLSYHCRSLPYRMDGSGKPNKLHYGVWIRSQKSTSIVLPTSLDGWINARNIGTTDQGAHGNYRNQGRVAL
jgi:hypothetical protein